MRESKLLSFVIALVVLYMHGVNGEDPYRFFTWKVTYGDIYPLGVKQQVLTFAFLIFSRFWLISLTLYIMFVCFFLGFWKQGKATFLCLRRRVCGYVEFLEWMWDTWLQGILINGQFPGPQIDAVTNDNLVISIYNELREPFLISW